MKQKASSDVKGSLWNHLDKTICYGIMKNVKSVEGGGDVVCVCVGGGGGVTLEV